MKPDIYTKAVLTLIAVALTVVAFKPLVGPDTMVNAQSAPPFSGIQINSNGFIDVFDTRTGEFWMYEHPRQGAFTVKYAGKVGKLGQTIPLSVENK